MEGLLGEAEDPFSHKLMVFLLHNKLDLGLTFQFIFSSSKIFNKYLLLIWIFGYIDFRFEILPSSVGAWLMAILQQKPQCIGNIVCEVISLIFGSNLECEKYQC